MQVRQPVICANHHVFCSSCMEMWLKKASQCPTCRVPITAENPCREIIGKFTSYTKTNWHKAELQCRDEPFPELWKFHVRKIELQLLHVSFHWKVTFGLSHMVKVVYVYFGIGFCCCCGCLSVFVTQLFGSSFCCLRKIHFKSQLWEGWKCGK